MADLAPTLAFGALGALLSSTWGDPPEFQGGVLKTLAALVLVVLSMVLAHINQLGIVKDMAISIARAFLQLAIIGFVLNFIFSQSGWKALLLIFVAFCFMVTVAGITAGRRAKGVPNSTRICWGAIFLGCSCTMLLLVVLQIFEPEPRYLIPIAGMMVGNAMTTTGVALKRLYEDMKQTVPLVEAALALGAPPRKAVQQQLRRSLILALSPVLDNLKTLGLISLPGAMTGMILGGASPFEATKLQMIVATMLVGCGTLSSMLGVFAAWPGFFTPGFQVIHEVFQES